jgi:hypothetical protein
MLFHVTTGGMWVKNAIFVLNNLCMVSLACFNSLPLLFLLVNALTCLVPYLSTIKFFSTIRKLFCEPLVSYTPRASVFVLRR